MGYHIRTFATLNQESSQVWEIENDVAVRIGVTNAEQSPGCYFRAEPGESIWDALRRQTPWFEPNGECPFHQPVHLMDRLSAVAPFYLANTRPDGLTPVQNRQIQRLAISGGVKYALSRTGRPPQ
ncbi:hypothetical protein M0D69_01080 [Caballeronia sp. SEWSISQ10-4 2]|uniref:hypothetical protein n=1 Tax=Caballeronia sp. SEWSISQ10-4 2 TaxID=2937438 RepID=UPI00264CCDB1|nr:hypothetical protein [Caballeronia sp. SEWSISQ10-4 2]MDN7176637.1 hypothetical protein [Caballeronia sp. SEWSISQ10-4 2]